MRQKAGLRDSGFTPVPFYCEENIYRFCLECLGCGAGVFAVIVSNTDRRIALLSQKASSRPDGLVIWDYHVLAVYDALSRVGAARDRPGIRMSGRGRPLSRAAVSLVWDFDTMLPLPCPLSMYISATFSPAAAEPFRPLFRIVPAAEYVDVLVSDRSHMRAPSGRYTQAPPPWERPGEGRGKPNTLFRLIDMEDRIAGEVTDLAGLETRFPPRS